MKKMTQDLLKRLIKKHKKVKVVVFRKYEHKVSRVRILEENKRSKYHYGYYGKDWYGSCFELSNDRYIGNVSGTVGRMFKYDKDLDLRIIRVVSKGKTIWSEK